MRFLRQAFLFFCALSALFSWAQRLEVEAPSRASTDDYFALTYTISTTSAEHFTPPSLKDFTLLSGPNVSTSKGFTMINGRMSSSESTTYTLILQPTAKGRFIVPPASIIVNGKKVNSRAVTIEVTDGGGKSGRHPAPSHSNPTAVPSLQQAGSTISKADLFIKASSSRTQVFEQEAILLSYKVYFRPNIGVDNVQLAQKPEFKNLISQDIPPQQIQWQSERVNGQVYRAGIITQYVIFPQQKGTVTIPPITFNCIVVQKEEILDPLEAFFNGGGLSSVQVQRQSNALTLQVNALPTPKPIDFSGAVGKFTAKGTLLTTTPRTNEVATYRLTVSGLGNLKLITAPTLTFPKDFETFDPKSEEQSSATPNGTEGSIIFDYTFLPQNVGQYTIKAPTFVFFNPETKRYETITLNTLHLSVAKGSDTRPIITNELHPLAHGRRSMGWLRWGELPFWGIHLLLLILAIGCVLYLRHRYGLDTDAISFAKRRANNVAKRRFRKAKDHLSRGNTSAFYTEIAQALYTYVADKFHISRAEITKERIAECLAQSPASESEQKAFMTLITECELAQFAPAGQSRPPHELLQVAEQLIISINKAL